MITRAGHYQPGNDLQRVYARTQAITVSSITLVAIPPRLVHFG
jgi:hypothetical protein